MDADLAFLCRVYNNGWSSQPRDIDIEHTARPRQTGNGTVVGTSTVYFLRAPGPPQVCQPKTPLTYENISVYRIAAGGSFNVVSWSGTGGAAYSVSAIRAS